MGNHSGDGELKGGKFHVSTVRLGVERAPLRERESKREKRSAFQLNAMTGLINACK